MPYKQEKYKKDKFLTTITIEARLAIDNLKERNPEIKILHFVSDAIVQAVKEQTLKSQISEKKEEVTDGSGVNEATAK